MSPFAPLGRDVAVRGQKCGYSTRDSTDTDCPADASRHILWNATTADASFACDPHMTVARARFVFVDSHSLSPDCGMPNAAWDFDNKRCVYPDESTSLIAAAEQPAPASSLARP